MPFLVSGSSFRPRDKPFHIGPWNSLQTPMSAPPPPGVQEAGRNTPVLTALRAFKGCVCAAHVLLSWGEPVLMVRHEWALWPLGSTLVAPHRALRGMGFITAMPWVALCDRASNALLGATLSLH